MSLYFPFNESISMPASGKKTEAYPYAFVLEKIWPLLTEERRQKIQSVVSCRTFDISIVLENIYDRGNASAVMRSSEAFGFAQMDAIEPSDQFKESQRTTAGADKWIELRRWKTVKDCVDQIKKEKKQIVVTHLSASSKPISEIDFTKPTALVLGNEKNGASSEIIEAADHTVILPMVGFVQSFNISVAGALCAYHMFEQRKNKQDMVLDFKEQEILKAIYALRTQPSGEDILREEWRRK
jgi:tRNA (guanosine-2'-O-)-methyltransferase